MAPTAIVAGAGPNGLAAAIVLARAGFSVEIREAAAFAGGGARSAELTLPGFVHDLGSAVHPLAMASPFFSTLRLGEYGLDWASPDAPVAHPLEDGSAVMLERDLNATANGLGQDAAAYRSIFQPLVEKWEDLRPAILRPLRWPEHPLVLAGFGLRGVWSARGVAESHFRGTRARALFAGLAAHSFLPLESLMTSAIALMLGVTGHTVGWPIPRGGAQKISNALEQCLLSAGGRVVTSAPVRSLEELGEPDLVMLDLTPRQLLQWGSKEFDSGFRRELQRYRYGPGVFKVDWALSEPIPWRAKDCLRAGTVHLGGTLPEIAESERAIWQGEVSRQPFVLLSQPTLFDACRAPAGKHTAWAYCHVPNAWRGSALDRIEAQIERFAPGFRECILARAAWDTSRMQAWNENLVGGDINGGAFSGLQFFVRPTWRLYSTPLNHVYLCSSSTPPGGGVHGMCGYWAAQRALENYRGNRSNTA